MTPNTRQLVTTLIITLLLAATFYFMQTLEASQRRVTSLEELYKWRDTIIDSMNVSKRTKTYYKYLSGKIIEISGKQLESFLGTSFEDLCFNAYVNGSWIRLYYIPYTEKWVSKDSVTYYPGTSTLTSGTRIMLKLPVHPPEYVYPIVETPPAVLGARLWGWINVSVDGYTYPILVAAGSQQIRDMCGDIPYMSHTNVWGRLDGLEKRGLPVVIRKLLFDLDVEVSIRVIEEYIYTIDKNISIKVSVSNEPLPGGVDLSGWDDIVWSHVPSELVSFSTGRGRVFKVWKPIVMSVGECHESFSFRLFPWSPESGVSEEDIYIRKIKIKIIGKTLSSDAGTHSIDLKLTVKPRGADQQVIQGVIITGRESSGSLDVDIVPGPRNSYGFKSNTINVTLEVMGCQPRVEWVLSPRITYYIKIKNNNYYNKNLLTTLQYKPIDTPTKNTTLTTLTIPAGHIKSLNITLPLYTINNTAIIKENTAKTLNMTLPLIIRTPPLFPGGTLRLYIDHTLGTWTTIPPNLNNHWATMKTHATLRVTTAQLISLMSSTITTATANIRLYKPTDRTINIHISIDTTRNNGLRLHAVPIISHQVENADYIFYPNNTDNIILTPIYNANKITIDLTNNYLPRTALITNIYNTQQTNLYTAQIRIYSQTKTSNLKINAESLYSAGRILGFQLNTIVNYNSAKSCSLGSIEVLSLLGERPVLFDKEFDYFGYIITIIDNIIDTINYKSMYDGEIDQYCDPNYNAVYNLHVANLGWMPNGLNKNITIIINDIFSFTENKTCLTLNTTTQLYLENIGNATASTRAKVCYSPVHPG